MKITTKQLRTLIREEFRRNLRTQLREFANQNPAGDSMKQGVEQLWQADNAFKQALSQASDNSTHQALDAIHKAIEKLAFDVDGKMQQLVNGAGQQQQPAKKKNLPSAPPPSSRKPGGQQQQ